MKKLTTLLAAAAMLFVMSGKAQAVPFYYTFDGIVNSYGFDDSAGAIAIAGLSIGSAVTYTFIVDFDVDGFYTYVYGGVITMSDAVGRDYFFTDYVSGDALLPVDGGLSGNNVTAEYNYGVDLTPSTRPGLINGNSANDGVSIYSNTANVSDWAVNDTVASVSWAVASSNWTQSTEAWSYLYADLTITDISPVNAVPEPSTLLLLASGFIGLGFFRRKTAIA